MTWGKLIFRSIGFNIQMTSFDKYQKSVLLPLDIIYFKIVTTDIIIFSHLYILEKYFKDKFTISYFFSVHAPIHHANLGKHGCLRAKWPGKVNLSRPTHYGISIRKHYAWDLFTPTTIVDFIQYLDRKRWIKCFSCKKMLM